MKKMFVTSIYTALHANRNIIEYYRWNVTLQCSCLFALKEKKEWFTKRIASPFLCKGSLPWRSLLEVIHYLYKDMLTLIIHDDSNSFDSNQNIVLFFKENFRPVFPPISNFTRYFKRQAGNKLPT